MSPPKPGRSALAASYDHAFHQTGLPAFGVLLRNRGRLTGLLYEPRLERAIGVVYKPHTERARHYFEARMSRQFDAVLHFDRTTSLLRTENAFRKPFPMSPKPSRQESDIRRRNHP